MKIIALLILFITTNIHAQVDISNKQKPSTYYIGTGISASYFEDQPNVAVESLHFFRDVKKPFDHALIKFGIGINFELNSSERPSYNFLTSVGYMYMQEQYHARSQLSRFGTGVTLDYTLVNTTGHAIGTTLYIVLNEFIVGIGGGGIITSEKTHPYINTSFAVVF